MGGYSLISFRWAMATQFLFYAVGIVGAYTERARARKLDHERGVRHPTLVAVLRREWSNLRVQWRIFRSPASVDAATDSLVLTLDDDRTVQVAAVLPGTGGQLVAIDVPPADAPEDWWHRRVGDYLDLVAADDLEIGAVEVRCPDSASTARVRALVATELAYREAVLTFEVVSRAR
jgi:hypothetical protein